LNTSTAECPFESRGGGVEDADEHATDVEDDSPDEESDHNGDGGEKRGKDDSSPSAIFAHSLEVAAPRTWKHDRHGDEPENQALDHQRDPADDHSKEKRRGDIAGLARPRPGL